MNQSNPDVPQSLSLVKLLSAFSMSVLFPEPTLWDAAGNVRPVEVRMWLADGTPFKFNTTVSEKLDPQTALESLFHQIGETLSLKLEKVSV